MATYGQINYQEKVGNGPYTLAQIGCFVTAFSNLLSRFSINEAPDTLNAFFTSHNVYLADPGDGTGVKDDLAWSSITAFNSGITVGSVGTGWPSSNNAIVKFIYKDPKNNNAETTHFCLVADHAAQTIVDSYDGKTKTPGEYGQRVAYATYVEAEVQAVPTPLPAPTVAAPAPPAPAGHPYTVQGITPKQMIAKANPTHEWDLDYTTWTSISDHPENSLTPGTEVTVVAIAHHNLGSQYYMTDTGQPNGYNVVDLVDAPAAAAAVAAPAPSATIPPEVFLPPSISQWHFYKPGGPWTLPNAIGSLDPQKYGGLTYPILGSPAPHIFLIKTEDFGEVAIYAGPDTVAQFPEGGHGDGEATPPAPEPGLKVVDNSGGVETPAAGTTIRPTAVSTLESDVVSFKRSFKESIGPLVSNNKVDVWIKDLEGALPPQLLKPRSLIAEAGIFWKDGQKYVQTIQSAAEGHFYALSAELCSSVSPAQRKKAEQIVEDIYDKYHNDIEEELDELFGDGLKFEDDIEQDIKKDVVKHEKRVNEVGKVLSFLHLNKK